MDGEIITCWCGARGTFAELFDDEVFEQCCGGLRTLHCECGGDGLCVCHHHGEIECPGCEDCEGINDDAYDWSDDMLPTKKVVDGRRPDPRLDRPDLRNTTLPSGIAARELADEGSGVRGQGSGKNGHDRNGRQRSASTTDHQPPTTDFGRCVTGTDSPSALPMTVAAPLARIEVHPANPRLAYPTEEIEELAKSLAEHGLIQPITVRPHPQDKQRYQIVCGHRRYLAAKKLHWQNIPAIVRRIDDVATLKMLGAENVERQDLNPIELAAYLATLTKAIADGGAGMTPAQAAAEFGKTESWAVNNIRLLELPEPWRGRVISGEMEPTKARCLVPLVKAPRVLQKIDEAWKREYEPLRGIPRDEFQEAVAYEVENETRDPESQHYYPNHAQRHGCLVDLTNEHVRQQLEIVELPVRMRRGNQWKVVYKPLITNVAAYDKMQQAILDRKAKKKQEQADGSGVGGQGSGKAGKEKPPTAAEIKAKQREQARVLGQRIERWGLALKRFWVADQLLREAGDCRAAQRVRSPLVARMLLWFAAHEGNQGWLRDAVARACAAAGKTIERYRTGSRPEWKAIVALEATEPLPLLHRLCAEFLWPTAERDPYDVDEYQVPDAVVQDAAAACAFDAAQAWSDAQADKPRGAKDLVQRFFELHNREQLAALGQELGVHIPDAATKSGAIKLFQVAMTSRRLKLPGVLKERKKRTK